MILPLHIGRDISVNGENALKHHIILSLQSITLHAFVLHAALRASCHVGRLQHLASRGTVQENTTISRVSTDRLNLQGCVLIMAPPLPLIYRGHLSRAAT